MSNSFDKEQAKDVIRFLKSHPNQTFYLDEPFLNDVTMDHYHLLLRNMESMEYIKSQPPEMNGMSKTYSAIPRVGYRFTVLLEGERLLNTRFPRQQ